jgi:hypothetical protein
MARCFSVVMLAFFGLGFSACAASAETPEDKSQSTSEDLSSCGGLGQVCCNGGCNAGLQPNFSLGYCRCANKLH